MFLMVGKSKCPYCGVEGKVIKEEPKVYICPSCSTVYTHYGIVIQGKVK